MTTRYYRLDGHEPVPCSVTEWGTAFENMSARRVALTELPHGVVVSTVFLGLDHSFAEEGSPILFETCVFGLDGSDVMERCSTWAQAEAQHERIVRTLTERGGRGV